jgi:protein-S-isoprenylcysteine O-methyltransferase Ste14
MTMTHEMVQTEQPDHAGVAFHPPILLLLALLLGVGARWLTPLPFVPDVAALPIGLVVVAASLGWFVWAVVTMRRGGGSIPTSKPTEAIIRRGPYAWSRNPIYLSMVVLQVGVGLWANSVWFLGLAAVSAWLLWWGVISREERYLERKFGDVYLDYKAHVRRWI